MVSLVEASKCVHACKRAVQQAEAALEDAHARLADVVAQTEAYVVAETAEREAEDAAKKEHSLLEKPHRSQQGVQVRDGGGNADGVGSPDVGARERGLDGTETSAALSMKPFTIQLSEPGV
jgi:hypothetical protein